MEARQVFGGLTPAHDERTRASFCPRCGAKCEERVDGGTRRSVCTACTYIHYVNPVPAVSVLIVEDGRVLLERRSARMSYADKWCLPSGIIEYREDFLTAAIREVREETGLEIAVTRLLSVNSYFHAHGTSAVVIVLLADVIDGELRLDNDEVSELGWFDPAAMPELAFDADEHIIARYLATGLEGAPVDPLYAGLTSPTRL